MPFWPNATLAKCQLDQMPTWPNAALKKCCFDQMPLWQNATLTKCLFDQNAKHVCTNVTLTKCKIGQMPVRTKGRIPKLFHRSNKKRLLKLYPSPSLQNFFPVVYGATRFSRMTHRMTLAEWRTVDQVLAEWHTAELHSAFLILLIDIELNKLECLTLTFLLNFHVCE